MNRTRFASFSRKPSQKASLAAAAQLLLNARTLDNITAETLVRCYGLAPLKAEQMLVAAKKARADG